MPNLDDKLVAEIEAEICCAIAKFPANTHLTVALMEEVGEAAQAQLQGRSKEAIRKELIQVIGLAVRLINEGDADLKDCSE